MSKVRIAERQVNGVPVKDIFYRHDTARVAMGTVADKVSQLAHAWISGLYGEQISDYHVRGIKAVTGDALNRITLHGTDRYSPDFTPPYEHPATFEIFDPMKTAWVYPIKSIDSFYQIRDAIGHAAEERRHDPSLMGSMDPAGLLFLRKAQSVELGRCYYAFIHMPRALGLVVLAHIY